MMGRVDIRIEKGKAIIETGVKEGLNLLKLAVDHGLIESEKIIAKSGSEEEKIEEEQKRDREVVPSVKTLYSYILSQTDYTHNTCGLHNHFFGRVLDSRDADKNAYDATYRALLSAHRKIEKDYDGTWEAYWDHIGGRKCKRYLFIRNKQEKPTGDSSIPVIKPFKESLADQEDFLAGEPSLEEVRDYVKSKGHPYEHSMAEITEYFLGHRIHASDNRALYERIARKIRQVRGEIDEENEGHWVPSRINPSEGELYDVFRFIKKDEAFSFTRGEKVPQAETRV